MNVLRTALHRALLAFVLAAAGIAQSATTLTVTTTNMVPAADGNCSLPEALAAANSNATVFDCVVGGGGAPFTIVLGSFQTYTITAFVTDPTVGPTAAVVTTDIEIIGNGSTITRSGADFRLIASYTPGVTLTLRNLTLLNGVANDLVSTFGTYGGAIVAADGVVQLDRVLIGGSTAANGSAIATAGAGTLNILNSAIGQGTGASTILVLAGTINIANTTVGLNASTDDLRIDAATALNLRNTTFQGLVNVSNIPGPSDVSGNIFFGGCTGTNLTTLAAAANIAPASCPVATLNDLSSVQPIGNNGGGTLTAALTLPSAAADANLDCTFRSSGTNTLFTNGAAITTDQRLFPRPPGACDIGAYEAARFNLAAPAPNAIINQAYDSGTVTVDGATPFASFLTGTLPAGLSIFGSLATGTFNLVGTPTVAGTFLLQFNATDANGMRSYQTFPLLIIDLPGAPVPGTLTTGDGTASIAFTPPGSDGGSAITGYRAKCNAGAIVTPLIAASPITGNLPNGASYSCQLFATNIAGEGPGSTAINFTLPATVVSSITRASANPTGAASVQYTVTFSRAVTGVDASDFALAAGFPAGASITGVTGSGTTYTVTVGTGTGGGTVRLDLIDNDSIVDASTGVLGGIGAGNGSFTTGESYTVTSLPGAPIIGTVTPGNGQASIAFSPAPDGGSAITGYRAQCTPGPVVSGSTLTSPIIIGLANGGTYSCVVIATNANGDGPASPPSAFSLVATTVTSVVRASANPTNAASVNFTVTFSRSVTGVNAADFVLTTTGTLSGSSVASVSGSGAVYTVGVTLVAGSGTVRLDVVDDDSITDGSASLGGAGVGNGNFATGESYTVTTTPGAPAITSATPGSGQASIAFSAPGSDGGSAITGYRAQCTPGPVVSASSLTSPIVVTLANGAGYSCVVIATNANGDGPPSAPATFSLAATAVSSVVRASANPTSAASVNFTVTFSRAVTGVNAADFVLTTTGTLTGSGIASVSGSGAVYTVGVTLGTGSGTVRLDVVDDDSITDGSASLGGPGAGNGNFSAGEIYTVNRDAPLVSSIVRVGASPTSAASVSFTVTFSQSVTGVNAADFVLTTTGALAGSSIASVTGSGTVYTVVVTLGTGSGTVRLDVVDDDSIVGSGVPLGGAGAGNGNFATGEIYTVDRTAPTVTSSVRVGADPVTAPASRQFTVTFSKAVTGVDIGDFALTNTGTATATLTSVSGSGTTYTVTVNITGAGASGGTVRLDVVDNDSIIDALGNALGGAGAGNGAFTTGQAFTVGAAPAVSFSGASATGSGTITATFTGGGATCAFSNPQFIPVTGHAASPPAGTAPAGVAFPHGLFDFSLVGCTPGSTVNFLITYPAPTAGLVYYKYGPEPGNATPHWYVLPSTAAGNTISFSITDGGQGDDDLAANGTIVDQGGPGTPGSAGTTAIPTMSEWAMILMSLLLFGMAAGPLRRRRL